jgi:hypothetical protein
LANTIIHDLPRLRDAEAISRDRDHVGIQLFDAFVQVLELCIHIQKIVCCQRSAYLRACACSEFRFLVWVKKTEEIQSGLNSVNIIIELFLKFSRFSILG